MRKVALAALALLWAGSASAAEICDGITDPIIDVHLHAFASDPRWERGAANPATGAPLAAKSEPAHRALTLAELKRHGVVRAVIDGGGTSGDQDAGLRALNAAPERLRLSAQVALPTPEALARIRRLHATGQLAGIGEVLAQYHGVSPNDPRMEPLWALAEELDLPVGIHVGLGPPGVNRHMPDMRMRLGNPLLLEDVLVRHPNLRVYVMHAGWPHLDGMLAMLHSFPQLFADVSVIDWAMPEAEFYTYLRRLVEAGFGDRIMFGSDQMVWPDAIGTAINRIQFAPFLTSEQKRNILFNNAVRFFRWTDLAQCGPQ